jgi:hypothetical protein
VHIAGSGKSGGTALSLDVVDGHGKGGGSISVNGETFETVLDGTTIYLRADAASWTKLSSGNAALANLLAGKWLKTTTSNQDFSDFQGLLDISQFVSNLSPSGTVTKGAVTTIGGVSVIPLKDTGSDGGMLYVASTGTPFIVSISGGGGDQGTLTFDHYNSATLPAVPTGAVDLDALERGSGSTSGSG